MVQGVYEAAVRPSECWPNFSGMPVAYLLAATRCRKNFELVPDSLKRLFVHSEKKKCENSARSITMMGEQSSAEQN